MKKTLSQKSLLMTLSVLISISLLILTLLGACSKQKDVNQVGVLHWWTSGGEAAALNVLKEDLEGKGVAWEDIAVAGGGGEQAMTALRARVAAGDSPTAVQMLGFDIVEWAQEGVLADLNTVANENNWDTVIPLALQKFAKYDGKWISAPVNVHSVNWVWGNKAIFDELGLSPPQTWDEFIAAAKKIKKAGYIPIAHGGQAWQEATVFDSLVYSVGGIDFYTRAMIDLDPAAINSKEMQTVFNRLRDIRDLVDPNFPGRDWNLATAMVIEGKAGMQIMGDWAKGEFIKANQVPDEDFLCFRFPGTQEAVIFNSDQFVMFEIEANRRNAQNLMAVSIMDPVFQSAFNVVKGSVPARVDVPDDDFDDCGKKAMAQLTAANNNNTMVGSFAHGHASPAAVKNAMYDVITQFFNSDQSSQAAAQALTDAVGLAVQ
ncbi:sugar ABC transporter substrate-binding protein [Spirochaetota bacterium]|nr:sugar ABC transporter substrate-binding protein [Spirochaetota bacterium]